MTYPARQDASTSASADAPAPLDVQSGNLVLGNVTFATVTVALKEVNGLQTPAFKTGDSNWYTGGIEWDPSPNQQNLTIKFKLKPGVTGLQSPNSAAFLLGAVNPDNQQIGIVATESAAMNISFTVNTSDTSHDPIIVVSPQ